MTSTSLSCPAADSGRGNVLNLVWAEFTLTMDESILRSLDRLVESPVVNEWRRSSNVQARTLESTRAEKESAIFWDMAPEEYIMEDFVQDVRDPRLCAAFCSTCAAFAESSGALFNTEASI